MKRFTSIGIILAAFGFFTFPIQACDYVVGDINGNGHLNGMDIVYAVNYFNPASPGPPLLPQYLCECPPGSGNVLFAAGDVNGSCTFTGLDVMYMVRYFKGGAAPIPCSNCPPTPLFMNKTENEAR